MEKNYKHQSPNNIMLEDEIEKQNQSKKMKKKRLKLTQLNWLNSWHGSYEWDNLIEIKNKKELWSLSLNQLNAERQK